MVALVDFIMVRSGPTNLAGFFLKKNWHTFVWDWDMNRNHRFTNISEDLKKKFT
jgi:hypothetical protein